MNISNRVILGSCLAVGSLIATAARNSSSQAEQAEQSPPARRSVLKTEFGDLEILPADNPWNTDVSRLPVHPKSPAWLASIGLDKPLHPDFGTVWNGAPNGIPYAVVGRDQPKVAITFQYADESDAGPYPIPKEAQIEGGEKSEGDRHVIVVDFHGKKLYEMFSAQRQGADWKAGSGAVFDLTSNNLRPAGWTSADAAGLPIFPGLARYEEAVEQGEIRHALRFTARKTQRGYITPATHFASRSNDANLPPMGLRIRLKADFDISRFPKTAQVILRGLKTHGMLLADNGGDWFISGAPHPRWNDDELNTLKKVKGSDFECVETGPVVTK